jgi:hypothetical protein
MTSSLRACLAAESWKRLWPEGNAPGQGRKKKGEEIKSKNILIFEDFAKQSFKVSETYAKQDLTGTYKTYQGRVKTPTKHSNAAERTQTGKVGQ